MLCVFRSLFFFSVLLFFSFLLSFSVPFLFSSLLFFFFLLLFSFIFSFSSLFFFSCLLFFSCVLFSLSFSFLFSVSFFFFFSFLFFFSLFFFFFSFFLPSSLFVASSVFFSFFVLMQAALPALGLSVASGVLGEMMERMGPGNGTVDVLAFLESLHPTYSGPPLAPQVQEVIAAMECLLASSSKSLLSLFRQLDRDDNGKLDLGEICHFMEWLSAQRPEYAGRGVLLGRGGGGRKTSSGVCRVSGGGRMRASCLLRVSGVGRWEVPRPSFTQARRQQGYL